MIYKQIHWSILKDQYYEIDPAHIFIDYSDRPIVAVHAGKSVPLTDINSKEIEMSWLVPISFLEFWEKL